MSSHEPRELPQRLGTSHARAARTTEAENLLTRLLALGILERPRLIESSAVTVVAGVEPPPFHKSLQSQAFTRHEQQSRGELGNRSRCESLRGEISPDALGGTGPT